MLDRRTFDVPVMCPACDRLVTISYAAPIGEHEIKIFHWQCPYEDCSGQGTFRLHGDFLGATKGLPRYFAPKT